MVFRDWVKVVEDDGVVEIVDPITVGAKIHEVKK